MQNLGIDDMAIAIPSLYLPIKVLADARDIDPAKLERGLGLHNMAVCDADEDVITLASRAVIDLVARNNLSPESIGRIYVGTESGIDGSKPIASYIHGLLTEYYTKQDVDCAKLRHCDAVDMTFACIGAVDAMHNCLAWLHTPMAKDKVAIVVATDDAKYELASTGEYTQGAGAIAVLLKSDPRLIEVNLDFGVGMCDEHDFFKPLRLKKNKNGQSKTSDQVVIEHKDTPVFDGPFSNQTYGLRIKEAWDNYQEISGDSKSLDEYARFIFHLPYAYHGRRIMPELYFHNLNQIDKYDSYLKKHGLEEPSKEGLNQEEYKNAKRTFLRARTKTPSFGQLISHKIEPSERLSGHIGNVYTASVFIALMSTLLIGRNDDLGGKDILFVAYGSGSKSKVFKGTVSEKWTEVVDGWDLNENLNERKEISFDTYINLRRHLQDTPVNGHKVLKQTGTGILETNKYARYYSIKEE